MNFSTIKYSFLTVLISILVTVAIFEIIFRFLPVKDGSSYQEINDNQSITRYEPNKKYTWSQKWNFQNVNKGRINNEGFVNDQDYIVKRDKPLVSVIGDSYIEARMVPYEETLQGRLAKEEATHYNVYSFATDGSPLSNYLTYAKHVSEKYKTDKIIFFIVGNDFVNSFPEYRLGYGHYQFFKNKDNGYTLNRALDYKKSGLSWFVQHSYFVRYMIYNLSYDRYLIEKQKNSFIKKTYKKYPEFNYVGRILDHHSSKNFSKEAVKIGRNAVDEFLKRLPQYTDVSKENILFVMDAHSASATHMNYHYVMSKYMQRRLKKEGYPYIDMNPIFADHYSFKNSSLRVRHDGHLNGIAHGYMADAVMESEFLQ